MPESFLVCTYTDHKHIIHEVNGLTFLNRHRGQVWIGLKDAVFQSSSPLRHAAELQKLLLQRVQDRTMLFIYADGGPDHRLTYVSVQLSLIALFLNLNLDVLIACRTAPNHSWTNPVKRIMSILNIVLQCVGLMRKKMCNEFEADTATCNNLKQLREALGNKLSSVLDSLKPVFDLLHSIFTRLTLKGETFKLYNAASEADIEEFWSVLLLIDGSLTIEDTSKKVVNTKKTLCEYIKHCCQVRHYSFQIKKCGLSSCTICKAVTMDSTIFHTISFLPDPTPKGDGHYKMFSEQYGLTTSEEYRPSMQVTKKSAKQLFGFSPSQQHVRNINLLLQCEECDMWRLLFSKYKLYYQEKQQLEQLLDDVAYTCGVTFLISNYQAD